MGWNSHPRKNWKGEILPESRKMFKSEKENCRAGKHSLALYKLNTGYYTVACIHCNLSGGSAKKKADAKKLWTDGPKIPNLKILGKLKLLLDFDDLYPKPQVINIQTNRQSNKPKFKQVDVVHIELILIFQGSLLENADSS